LRSDLLGAARKLDRLGLNQGQAGNLSLRTDSQSMFITPSGIAADMLTENDLVLVKFDGSVDSEQRRPSSEWCLHAHVYEARSDLKALVHTHSPYATALACLGQELPAFHYMVALAGANQIPCSDYATFGSVALAEHCVKSLGTKTRACLMAHHGLLAAGQNLDDATDLAIGIEHLAKIYCIAKQIGQPKLLTEAQMRQVHERMRDYGQSQSGD
jgi:L-fuculose-phosphate aldolase